MKFFNKSLLFLLFFMSFSLISAQPDMKLSDKFKKYDIVHTDSRNLHQQIQTKRNGGLVSLKLSDKYSWDLNLQNSNIISSDYVLTVASEDGIVSTKGTTALPMKGSISGNPHSKVSLTFDYDFIYGFIETDETILYIEPLRHYVKDATNDAYIVYNTDDIISSRQLQCGYEMYKEELERYRPERHEHTEISGRANQCYTIEIDLAADYSMVQKYGSVSGAQNHNLGVLNNVQTNYDDDFADELQFQLNEQWISSCSSCDPWTSSTDSGAFLNSFTSWAPGGFTTGHDVASLWTNRDFNGGTIGLAWVGTVCTNYRYNVLQDFSSDAQLKRCMQAHEIGHNFNADHSSTGIMAPTVSSTNFWEAVSKTEIESYYGGISCLSLCTPSNAPIADFTFTVLDPCINPVVQFTNTSSYATTYSWSFPGGSPASSTQKDPLVTYVAPGVYTVTLIAYNGPSSDTEIRNINVDGINPPVADFSYTKNGKTVNFTNQSLYATSYIWDFGDGSAVSYDVNPSHTYLVNGIYEVSLTAINQCENSTTSYNVEILVLANAQFTSNVNTGCNPLTVNFSNQSTNADSYLWSFPGGTPSSSTEENPVVIYNNAGAFDVTLEAINGAGSKFLTYSDYIVVNETVVPGFTYVKNGSQVTFTDTSHYATTISWNFGDGGTSNEQNPVHIYSDNGTYTVIQTVTNGCSSKNKEITVIIAVAPVPSFSSDYTGPICVEESVQFTNTSTYSPTSYLWTFEGGTPATSTDENPVVQYMSGGTYDVTLSVTNANGTNQIILDNYIVVDPKPTVSYTYVPDGLKLDFTQQINYSNNQSWNFGDGSTSTAVNPSHTYLAEGLYVVSLKASNRCGETEYISSVNVLLAPTADFGAASAVICPGGSVQFDNLSSPSTTSWEWTFAGGSPATSTEKNPSVTYTNSGNYDVTLTVYNSSGQGTVTKQGFVTVVAPVTASFTGVITDNTIVLTNTGSGSTSSSWDIFKTGFAEKLSGNNPIFTAPENGTYSVVLTNTNQCGQAISDTIQFVISAYPVASFTANNGGVLCADATIQFAGLGGNSYQWTFDGGNPASSSENNPQVIYTLPGTYNVILVATNNFGTDTLHSTVNVTTIPNADFDYVHNGGQVQFTLTGSGHSAQLWNFGDNSTSTDANPSHTYASSGEYTVTLITSKGCGNDTIVKTIPVTVSVKDIQNEYGIQVFPNPVKDQINIRISKPFATEYKLQLISSTGQLIKERQMNADNIQGFTLDVNDVNEGLYLLNIKTDRLIIPYKVFILR